jgi:hypothetical protein
MANAAQDNKAFTTIQATKAATFAYSLAEQAKFLAAEEHRQASSVTILNEPALVLYGISILIFFPDIYSDTRTIGIIALLLAAGFWLCHSLVFKLFCKAGKDINRSTDDYLTASVKFFTVILIQTYKITNPFTRFDGLTRLGTQRSEKSVQPMDSDFWTKQYISNYMGLISSAHKPVYSLHAYKPTAPLIDEDEDYVQVPKGNPSPIPQYSYLPNRV